MKPPADFAPESSDPVREKIVSCGDAMQAAGEFGRQQEGNLRRNRRGELLASELSKSQAELKSIFRAAPIGIGMVIDRVIQEVNDLQNRGGTLVVVGLSGRVARAFNLLRLGSLVPTADTVRSAISQIHGNGVPKAATGTHG